MGKWWEVVGFLGRNLLVRVMIGFGGNSWKFAESGAFLEQKPSESNHNTHGAGILRNPGEIWGKVVESGGISRHSRPGFNAKPSHLRIPGIF